MKNKNKIKKVATYCLNIKQNFLSLGHWVYDEKMITRVANILSWV